MALLTSLWCQCREVKFYNLPKRKKWLTGELRFKHYPGNVHDANCAEVYYESKPGVWLKLDNVVREIAEWLSPLIMGPFHITG